MKFDVAVLGAGPAGLGAGCRLAEQERASWMIFEASGRVGGLASSRVDAKGFTWDIGGHVIFSSNPVFNGVVERALGPDALTHTRESYIRTAGRFVPFPLQNNIHRLPPRAMRECLDGLAAVEQRGDAPRPAHFGGWIPWRLGEGISRHFMTPYNKKLWAHPLEEMGCYWIDGRVATPSPADIRRAILNKNDNHAWGPNATFRFPRRGGTGGLFNNIASGFAPHIALRHEAVRVDAKKKTIIFKNGKKISYGALITTAPLDHFVKKMLAAPGPDILHAASGLKRNSGLVVGIGINRFIKNSRCWVYFPDPAVPFYRVTYFSNYSPLNVPRPGAQTSFMCEISSGPTQKRNPAAIVKETVDGLVKSGLIRPDDRRRIASAWMMKVPYLYPIPTLARDASLAPIEERLRGHGIRSVGRFGGWRYETGNMDHSFMAGHEAAAAFL
ncbi:MAG: FAD-dependent oxidoreductase [Nitrospinae bacterium]|nr:FAD-dependent oxidoreductase [Nitrospinota bacterium]